MPKVDLSVFSWDNKLPGAELLLTRLRMFLNPGYPYEETLSEYFNATGINMCMGFEQFHVFNWTHGGLIELNHGRPQPLQYAVNMAFLASLYADYMDATNVPGWYCGPNYFSTDSLRSFAKSQVALQRPPQYACGCLFILSEVLKAKLLLWFDEANPSNRERPNEELPVVLHTVYFF